MLSRGPPTRWTKSEAVEFGIRGSWRTRRMNGHARSSTDQPFPLALPDDPVAHPSPSSALPGGWTCALLATHLHGVTTPSECVCCQVSPARRTARCNHQAKQDHVDDTTMEADGHNRRYTRRESSTDRCHQPFRRTVSAAVDTNLAEKLYASPDHVEWREHFPLFPARAPRSAIRRPSRGQPPQNPRILNSQENGSDRIRLTFN
jgi:hypothetical protein